MFAEQYFTDNDLINKALPAAGDEQICIDFVGGPYLFSGLSKAHIDLLRDRFGELCLDPRTTEQAAVRTEVFQSGSGSFMSEWTAGLEYTLDVVHTADHVDIAGMFFGGRVQTAPAIRGDLTICAEETNFFLGGFENFFRDLVAYRLLDLGGLLLHSAGIVDDGRASIFFGVSGAGKTTLSRKALSEDKFILSDDLNALILEGDRVIVAPVPFAGDLGNRCIKPVRYRANGLFRLQQGEHCTFRPFTSSRFLASALVCLPFVNTNPYVSGRLENNVLQLSSLVATGEVVTQANTSFSQIMQCIEAAHKQGQEKEL
jgi:hypothetical protein